MAIQGEPLFRAMVGLFFSSVEGQNMLRQEQLTMRPQSTKKGSPVVAVVIAGFVVVVLVTGMVLYFFRDIILGSTQRSAIGGCINDVFRVSSETTAPLTWADGNLQLPTLDARSTIKSELPEDLAKYSFIAAVCCSESGQDISVCAEALRGFVDKHPDATTVISDDAKPIKDIAAAAIISDVVEDPIGDGAPEQLPEDPDAVAIAAVVGETREATQLRAAFGLLASADVGLRTMALKSFYAAKSASLRRASLIYFLEQTESGEKKIFFEFSVPNTAATETAKRGLQDHANKWIGKSMSSVKIDRATGSFSCFISGYGGCNGTVTDSGVGIYCPQSWSMKLTPELERPVLTGKYSNIRGQVLSVSVALM